MAMGSRRSEDCSGVDKKCGATKGMAQRSSCRGDLAARLILLIIATPIVPSVSSGQEPTFLCRPYTANLGAGWTAREGGGIRNGYNLDAGAGIALPPRHDDQDGVCNSRWRLYLPIDFFFRSSGIKQSAVEQAIALNPQIPALLSATSGTAKFYSLMANPTVRFRVGYIQPYVFGGFGWLRRTIDLAGTSTQGTLVVDSGQLAYTVAGNSGAFDVGLGLNFAKMNFLGGSTIYVEARRLQGLGINSGTTMWPFAVGIRW